MQVTYRQIQCAGKTINKATSDPKKWFEECKLMSSLRHPHITQFLGISFSSPKTPLPILVMELLETSLHTLLEDMPGLPLSLKCSVLKDVASGLLYLHEGVQGAPPLVHQDLHAGNVLLTSSLVAKITDVGLSYITDLKPPRSVYMPPQLEIPQGTDFDIYYFGILVLFTLLQVR